MLAMRVLLGFIALLAPVQSVVVARMFGPAGGAPLNSLDVLGALGSPHVACYVALALALHFALPVAVGRTRSVLVVGVLAFVVRVLCMPQVLPWDGITTFSPFLALASPVPLSLRYVAVVLHLAHTAAAAVLIVSTLIVRTRLWTSQVRAKCMRQWESLRVQLTPRSKWCAHLPPQFPLGRRPCTAQASTAVRTSSRRLSLLLVLCTIAAAAASGTTEATHLCSPGEFVSTECGSSSSPCCAACPVATYQAAEDSNATSCTDCAVPACALSLETCDSEDGSYELVTTYDTDTSITCAARINQLDACSAPFYCEAALPFCPSEVSGRSGSTLALGQGVSETIAGRRYRMRLLGTDGAGTDVARVDIEDADTYSPDWGVLGACPHLHCRAEAAAECYLWPACWDQYTASGQRELFYTSSTQFTVTLPSAIDATCNGTQVFSRYQVRIRIRIRIHMRTYAYMRMPWRARLEPATLRPSFRSSFLADVRRVRSYIRTQFFLIARAGDDQYLDCPTSALPPSRSCAAAKL